MLVSISAIVLATALLPGGNSLAQLYQVPAEYGMWDTWLMKEGDEYHLFFLQRKLTNIGRAVSKDLVSWTALPDIDTKAPPGHWDSDRAKTGMCVKDGERYVCFYGSMVQGNQKIGALISRDLRHWHKSPANPIVEITPPYYGGRDCRDLFAYFDPDKRIWEGLFCAQAGGGAPKLEPIRDKTLVAWAYLANKSQRGGGVLTLDYGSHPDQFDAIVFGEKRPGVWMTGSDSARRTDRDQSNYPLEDADPNELLQIAAVYQGPQITLYRNGEKYAEHDAGSQQVFPSGTAVVMGLRHLEAGANRPRFFAGAIEEARVYSVALDQESLRRLRLDQASEPRPPSGGGNRLHVGKPATVVSSPSAKMANRAIVSKHCLAQWTFENGSTADAMGTFPPAKLHGGARIVDGRLVLDGIDDYLATSAKTGGAACIAHVQSNDLEHWDYLPPIYTSDQFVNMEVPEYFEMGGRHYLLFSSHGSRKDVGGRVNASGTFYVMADQRDGPYRIPEDPLLLGSGSGRTDNYVARIIPDGENRIVYHHTCGGAVTFATAKQLRQRPDGSLWLAYHPALDGLQRRALLDGTDGITTKSQIGVGEWKTVGETTEGRSVGASVLPLAVRAANVMMTCQIQPGKNGQAGLVWRRTTTGAYAVILDASTDSIRVVSLQIEGTMIAKETIDRIVGLNLPEGPKCLRVLVRAHRSEIYCNDRWLFNVHTPENHEADGLGLIVCAGEAQFSQLHIGEIESLEIQSNTLAE